MVVGETKTLSALKLSPASYSGTNINQVFGWSVYDVDNNAVNTGRVATVNAGTGEITAVAPGYSIIRGRKVLNSQEYWVTFVLYVTTESEANYPEAFMRNAQTVKYADIENQTMASRYGDSPMAVSRRENAALEAGTRCGRLFHDSIPELRQHELLSRYQWNIGYFNRQRQHGQRKMAA